MPTAERRRPWTPEIVRERIRVTKLVKRLEQFALDEKDANGREVKMNAAQVTAALGIIKKAVPDLSAVELSGEVKTRQMKELTDEELARIASGSGAGAATEAPGAQNDPSVH